MNDMKNKIFIFLTLLAGILSIQSCDDEKQISFGKLPEAAQAFVNQYFSSEEVVFVEREKDDGKRDYKVMLANGTELDFNESGAWTSVDCKFSSLPAGLIPAAIASHIATNYPQAVPYKIEKEIGGYEISVTGGYNLLYSTDGTFIRQETDF